MARAHVKHRGLSLGVPARCGGRLFVSFSLWVCQVGKGAVPSVHTSHRMFGS